MVLLKVDRMYTFPLGMNFRSLLRGADLFLAMDFLLFLPYSTAASGHGFSCSTFGSRVGFCALTSCWKPMAVAQASEGSNIYKSPNIHVHVAAQITFDLMLPIYNFAYAS